MNYEVQFTRKDFPQREVGFRDKIAPGYFQVGDLYSIGFAKHIGLSTV